MSWRQYGGTSKLDKMSNLNVNTISTDSFRLHGPYQGDFDICGNLVVDTSMTIFGSLNVKNDVNIRRNTIIMNDLTVNGNVYSNRNLYLTDGYFTGNVTILRNTNNTGNVTIQSNALVYDTLYFDPSSTEFFHGENNKLGLNVYRPKYTLDICGNIGSVLNVYSSQESTRNVLVQNNAFKGISMNANTSTSSIQFYNDASLNINNPSYDGQIIYNRGGVMTFDVSSNTQVLSNMVISNRNQTRSDLSFAQSAHIYNETVVLYDNSWGTYLPEHYKNTPAKTGYAMTMVTTDTSSNTFMNLVTPNKVGLSVGGGAYPNDPTRAMGTMGWVDVSGYFIPAQTIVSGNNISKYRSTTGFNTYAPRTEQYVVDINGPVHITNGQIKIASNVKYQPYGVSKLKNYQQNIIAVGSPSVVGQNISGIVNFYSQYISYSNDGGQSWKQSLVNPVVGYTGDLSGQSTIYELSPHNNTAVFSYDNSFSVLSADQGLLWYTINGGVNWSQFVLGTLAYNFTSVFVDTSYVYALADLSLSYFPSPYTNLPYDNLHVQHPMAYPSQIYSIGATNGYSDVASKTTITAPTHMSAIHVTNTDIFLCGSGILHYNRNTIGTYPYPDISYNINKYSYNAISVINTAIVAVGNNGIISYSVNQGQSWTDTSYSTTTLNSVYVFDTSNAIAVGNSGTIVYSNNSFANWTPVPQEVLISSGNAPTLIDICNNFTGITMSDANTILISSQTQKYSSTSQYGTGRLYYCFFPNLFNRANNHVLDLCGNMRVSGDIRVDKQIIGNDFVSFNRGSDSTSVSTGTLVVTGGVGISGNTNVNGNVYVSPNSCIESILGGNINLGTNPVQSGVTRSINIGSVFNTTNTYNSSIVLGGHYDTIFVNAPTVLANGIATSLQDTNIIGNLTIATPRNGTHFIKSTAPYNNLDSTSITTGVLIITGGVGISANTFIGGNTSMGAYTYVMNSNTESTSISSGTMTVQGGVGITSNVFVGGNVTMTRGIESRSTSSGSLIVQGGVGFSANAFVGGNITTNGNVTALGSTESTTTSTGTLLVKGGAGVTGNVNIGGNTNIGANLFVNANTVVNAPTESTSVTSGSLIVRGGAGIYSNLSVGGNVTITRGLESTSTSSGSLLINGGAGISSNVFVGGNISTLGNTITYGNAVISSGVESTSTSTGTLLVKGGAGIQANLFVAGNVTVTRGIESTNISSGTVIIQGGVGINSNVYVGGNIRTINYTESTNTQTGALIVQGGAGVGGNVCVGGNINTLKNVNVGNVNYLTESISTTTGMLVVTGGTGISSNLFVGGNVTVTKGLESTSTSSGSMLIQGGVGISANLFVGGNATVNANIRVINGVESTSSSTGSLIVTGGLGISGNTNLGGNTNIGANVNISGNGNIGGNLSVGGNIIINKGTESTSISSGTLIVNGGTGISSNLYVGGNAVITKGTESRNTSSGALIVQGGTGISANLFVGGNVAAIGGIESTSTSTGTLIVSAGAGISANVFVGGNVTIVKGIDANTTASGSLIVKGGAGISANLFVGGNINIVQSYDSVSTSSGALIVQGGMGVGKNSYFAGNVSVAGTAGIAVTAGNINVTATAGNIFNNGTGLSGTGGISTSGGMYITANGITVTGGNVNVASSAGNIINNGNGISGSGRISTSGGMYITGNGITVTGGNIINNGSGISGTGAISTSNGLTVDSGGIKVTAGGITVSAGGMNVTGQITNNTSIIGGGPITTSGGLTVDNNSATNLYTLATSSTIESGGKLTVKSGGLTVDSGGITISSGALTLPSTGASITSSGSIGIFDKVTITTAGAITAFSYSANSDYRIKENIVPLDESYTVDNLNPVIYQTKQTQETHIGFIAHELQEHYPFMVSGTKDGKEIQSVNYTGLIGVLVKEIQTLKQQVKLMQNKTTPRPFTFVPGESLEDVRR
jgi:hypothetical protein